MKTRMLVSFLLVALVAAMIVPAYTFTEAQTPPPSGDVYTLTLSTNATGCSVTANPDQTTYLYNDSVQLTPVAAAGYTFSGWSGDASGSTNPLTVYLTSNLTVTAQFTQNLYNLTVYIVGNGTVTTPNNGTYLYGAEVSLNATAAEGWTFESWSDGTTTTALNITMTKDTNVTATFLQNQPAPTPTPTPAPTASPTPTATATPTPTPSPVHKSASLSTWLIVSAAVVILVGLVSGLLYQRKRSSSQPERQNQSPGPIEQQLEEG